MNEHAGSGDDMAATSRDRDPLQKVLREFRLCRNILSHVLSDFDASEMRGLLYNFDYNMIYPAVWPASDTKDAQYDLIGRNFFSLLPNYSSVLPFRPCFTVPSALELLDTIEHRHASANRLIESKDESQKLIDAFKKMESRSFDVESHEGQKIKAYLFKMSVTSDNMRLQSFLEMMKRKSFFFFHELVDIDKINGYNEDMKIEFRRIYTKMDQQRGFSDTRPIDDRRFHYKVDSWNIALRIINTLQVGHEVAHVCRHGIREYYPAKDAQLYSRHPMVAIYQIYAFFRASTPEQGLSLTIEARDFLEDAHSTVSESIKRIETYSVTRGHQLSGYERSRIDETYNKFVRPLFYDYANGGKAIGREDLIRMRDDILKATYRSITTPAGFQDRFKETSEGLREAATQVAEILPHITSDRLLEEYDLSGNPRIAEIRSKLRLS